MGERYILDTNAVSKAFRQILPLNGLQFMREVMEKESNYSVITRIELTGFKPDDEKTERTFQRFIDSGIEYGLTEEVIQQTIKIRRAVKIKLPDAIIAATAIVHNLTLLSDNDSDFLRVPGLKYLNPVNL